MRIKGADLEDEFLFQILAAYLNFRPPFWRRVCRDNRCLAVAGDWENSDKKRRSTDFKIVCVALKYTLSRGYTGDLLPSRV